LDFIFMLTRHDRTVAEAGDLIDAARELGVTHVGFKDVGVPAAVMQRLVRTIRASGAVSYLEVVSTTRKAVLRSLQVARDLGVDRVLGGTDLDAAKRILGDLSGYFPFPGCPIGHPTRLDGSAELVAEHSRKAQAMGCGGVDLLAYRATEADPLDLVRAARAALPVGRLIVAGSISTKGQIDALAEAGVDAITIGSAVFACAFVPGKRSLRGQIEDILAACAGASKMSA
jgi:hypothetical protein